LMFTICSLMDGILRQPKRQGSQAAMSATSTSPDQAFIASLLDMLARTVAGESLSAEANQRIARTLFAAFKPIDAMEAAMATRAVVGFLACMDSFARAAKPGVSDEKAIRLRSSAATGARQFDVGFRALRRPAQQIKAPVKPASAATPSARAQHGAGPPLPIPGLADAVAQATPRAGWRGSTALTTALPTVPVPG
jgi:hypothetical protein